MIYLKNKYYLSGNNVIVYNNVTSVKHVKSDEDYVHLRDVESGELIFPGKGWKEYIPQIGDILVPFHKIDSTPIHVGFRQFMGSKVIYHSDCKLIYSHNYAHNHVVVKCKNCDKELMQGINTGECVPLNYQPAGKSCKCEVDDTVP